MSNSPARRAMYYEKLEEGRVHCFLCPHNCIIKEGKTGLCLARKNAGGELYSLNYGRIASLALDPIEKKPLLRFHPGSVILSAGTFGCNLKCSFCQNWSIAHAHPETVEMTPQELVDKAVELKSRGNIGIAYTYNEPSIWYEFVYEACRLGKERGMCNVLVTNGFISAGPLNALLPFVDAMNIDVKAYTQEFYGEVCRGTLENVKQIVEAAAGKCHVEITTLVIPGLNDAVEEIGRMTAWISGISTEIPLHLTRFFPSYRMLDRQPTPVEVLKAAREKALEKLKYVYIGNV